MKKQLLALTLLALGFTATSEAKYKHSSVTVQPGGTSYVYSKTQPTVPAGVTVTQATRTKNGKTKRIKGKWQITNNSTQAVQVQARKK